MVANIIVYMTSMTGGSAIPHCWTTDREGQYIYKCYYCYGFFLMNIGPKEQMLFLKSN